MRSYTLILTFALCVAYVIAEKSALEVVSDSTIPFSLKFFSEIAKNNERNLICSSLSVQLILSMLAYGAEGNTANQMRDSLNLPDDDNIALQGFYDLFEELNNVGNNWVNAITREKIPKIVEDEEINARTRIMLLNAVYFNGKWANGFNKRFTSNKTFNYMENNVAKNKLVPTMINTAEYLHGELPDLKAKFIYLPYQNSSLKMLIVVPNEVNGLSLIERNLESFNYNSLNKAVKKEEVKLFLPKFKIEKEINLNPVLQKLRMTDMFTRNANFTGISNEHLMVSVVKQKAFIDVNEEGTEAAAVTYAHKQTLSPAPPPPPPLEFHVDNPFIFKILTNTNLEIFSGVVKNL